MTDADAPKPVRRTIQKASRSMKTPIDWFTHNIPDYIDLDAPGIYQWLIEGVGIYIGKSKRLRGRLKEYPNNVRKIAGGLPYRKNNPRGFRVVHHSLYDARKRGLTVTVSVLENCDLAVLNDRERFWIKLRQKEECGGLPVLNSN
jgi:hypothetical protein